MLAQLQDLDLQLLRLFVTVVESGGFSAAQGALGWASPPSARRWPSWRRAWASACASAARPASA